MANAPQRWGSLPWFILGLKGRQCQSLLLALLLLIPLLPPFKSSVYSTFIGQDTCAVLKVSHVFPLSTQVCQAADLPLVDSPLCSMEAPNHKDSGSKMSSCTSLRLLTFFKNREYACSGHHLIPSMCCVHKWCSVRVWSPRSCNLPRYSPLGGSVFPLLLDERAACSTLPQFNPDGWHEASWQSWLTAQSPQLPK